jgi:methionyl aminopeptidase
MSIETEADRLALAEVCRVVKLVLDALEAAVRPGVTTAELDRLAATIVAREGARSAPFMVYGFPGTVLISINEEVVHGVPGPRRILRGDLVKLDVTLEKNGYMGDAARTVLVEGASELAVRLRACAEAAFEEGAAATRAGVKVNEIGRAVGREARRWGFSVAEGLAGHGIGRTIHEPPNVGNDYDPMQSDVLTDGLVITIEPMIAAGRGTVVVGRDGWTVRTRDRSLAAHHEHTLIVTTGRPVLLTA